MSGLAGIVNTKRLLYDEKYLVDKMAQELIHREKESKVKSAYYENALFSCAAKDKLPFICEFEGNKYTIMIDGEIYNISEIKDYINLRYKLRGNESHAEIITILYHLLGNSFLKKINGIFSIAIWNESSKELLLARDRFGIKPLYYTIFENTIYFASEIKGLLACDSIRPVIDMEGFKHIFGIGPNIQQGNGIFKNIFELLPGTLATFNKYGFKAFKYWTLQSFKHTDSVEDTITKVHELTYNAIKNQVKFNENNLCCFLSGGLDSSIITALAALNSEKPVNTFSVEYGGNNEFFVPNEYQPNSDIEFINLMSKTFGTNHEIVTISPEELVENLDNAVIARDHPGLADIDSSLFCFCKNVGKNFDFAMSGECADEVFGGYPWFHRKEDFEAKTFPWSKNTELRQNIINKNILKSNELSGYIDKCYNASINETPYLFLENDEERRRREISHLNLNWFMYSLGERSERIGSSHGLNIRMPFCDYKLVEYVFNIPWNIKAYDGREKGLLRKCFSSELPEEIVSRKKSPYPKTHNPIFENLVKEKLNNILNDSDCKVKDLINTEFLYTLMDSESDYGKPWFGQLMAIPQLYAYLLQIDFWLRHYKISIEI